MLRYWIDVKTVVPPTYNGSYAAKAIITGDGGKAPLMHEHRGWTVRDASEKAEDELNAWIKRKGLPPY